MIINSCQLRAAGSKLDKVIPPQLEAAARSSMRTRGAGVLLAGTHVSERVIVC